MPLRSNAVVSSRVSLLGSTPLRGAVAAACAAILSACVLSAASDGGGGAPGARGGAAGGGGAGGDRACSPGMLAGFSAPERWALPAARCRASFDALASGGGGALAWSVLSLARGGAASLVVAKDACDPDVGATRWDVYDVDGEGYAATPRPYALPAARCDARFDAFAKTTSGAGVTFALLDLTADGLLDLVVTKDACDPDVGASRWDVYAGEEDGFRATPTAWALPAPRCEAAFDALARHGALAYETLALDDAGRPALVVTKDACDADVGASRWDVYAAEESGFAARPTAYGLPAPRCERGFDATGRSGAPLAYSLVDLTGDGRRDLVVTSDACDDALGVARWDVYGAGEDRFARVPSAFALPAPRCETPWSGTSDASKVAYALADLSCDDRPDLLVTKDPCDAEIGVARWDVYANDGAAFARLPASIALPAPRCRSAWDGLGREGASGSLGFAYASLDGEEPSLVVTHDACDAELGASRWDRYPAVKATR